MEDQIYISFDGLMKPKERLITLEKSKSLLFRIIRFFYRFSFPPGFTQFPGVKIIFIILFLHRLHFYSIFNFIEHLFAIRNDGTEINEYPAATAQAMTSAAILLAPLPGLIADLYFPRTQVISFCLFLSFIGSSVQSLFHTIYELNIVDIPDAIYWLVHIPAIVLLILGSSGIFALLVPVGLDQMEGAGEAKLKSYFNWHYWVGNFGYLFAFGRYIIYTPSFSDRIQLLCSSYLATFSIFLALIILKLSLTTNLLQWNQPVGTPISQITGVVCNGFKNKRSSQSDYRRLSLFDYAANENGGKFTYEEVFDVKTFFKILFVIWNMTWYFGMYNLLNTEFPAQGRKLSCDKTSYVSSIFVSFGDCLTVAVVLPIFELFRWKFHKIGFTKILYKFQLGLICGLFAVFCAWVLDMYTTLHGIVCHGKQETISSLAWILPQTIFIGLSECLAWIGAMEFVYAQSPHHMKGFIFGILQSITGIGWFFPNILHFFLSVINNCEKDCRTCTLHQNNCDHRVTLDYVYFTIYLLVSLVYVVVFWVIACLYKRRQRQRIEQWPSPTGTLFVS